MFSRHPEGKRSFSVFCAVSRPSPSLEADSAPDLDPLTRFKSFKLSKHPTATVSPRAGAPAVSKLAASVLVSLALLAGSAEALVPGTYTADAQGMMGPVPVTVTVTDREITMISVGPNRETPGVGAVAAPMTASRMVEAQSTAVDLVSGATLTSRAVIEAVEKALTAAGDDPAAWRKAVPAPAEVRQETRTVDLVVVGAGSAGMIAAVAAREAGLSVLVLEKADFSGGASGVCTGAFLVPGSHVQRELGILDDTPEKFERDLSAWGGDAVDPVTAKLYAENSGIAVDWLIAHGVRFDTQSGLTRPQGSETPRQLTLRGGCPEYAQRLRTLTGESGAEILTGTKVEGLRVENGRVTGLTAKNARRGVEYDVTAKAVLLATGGYGANRAAVEEAIAASTDKNGRNPATESLSAALYGGVVSAGGDGLALAAQAGATRDLGNGATVRWDGLEVRPGAGASLKRANQAVLPLGSILVNREGERVVNEAGAEDSILAAQRRAGGSLFLVMDEGAFGSFAAAVAGRGLTREMLDAWIRTNEAQALQSNAETTAEEGASGVAAADAAPAVAPRLFTPLIVRGTTLEEAARRAGIDPETLAETAARYNGFVMNGKDDDFGRPASAMTSPLSLSGSVYILEEKPRYSTTQGGLRANGRLQALTPEGTPIEGLWVAGEVARGALGEAAVPGTNLGWAATSGLTAGAVIANTLKREETKNTVVDPQGATAAAASADTGKAAVTTDTASSEPAPVEASARLPQSEPLPVTGPTPASALDRHDQHPAEGPSARDAALDGSR